MIKRICKVIHQAGNSLHILRFIVYIFITGACLVGFVGWLFYTAIVSEGHGEYSLEQKMQTLLLPRDYHSIPESVGKDQRKIAIYVLGGSQDSLRVKYATVASLYRAGIGKKVMILHVPGKTEYDMALGRNLTNDEWSFKQLFDLGLAREDLEAISIPNYYFGTFSEARGLAGIMRRKGIQRLLIVCSSYHTKRVLITFSTILMDTGVVIEIHPAYEKVGLGLLFNEYAKLVFYKNILIPLVVTVKEHNLIKFQSN
jgi:hypothetical protein